MSSYLALRSVWDSQVAAGVMLPAVPKEAEFPEQDREQAFRHAEMSSKPGRRAQAEGEPGQWSLFIANCWSYR